MLGISAAGTTNSATSRNGGAGTRLHDGKSDGPINWPLSPYVPTA
jgi:hypothetical protein